MILLVDTCVWSLSLRRRHGTSFTAEQQRLISELQQAIEEGRVSVVGIIRQEVLSGVREKTEFAKIQRLLAPFEDEDVIAEDYIEAARMHNTCQNHGVQCGAVDMLVAAVAARKNFNVITSDKGMARCLDVLRIPHS